MKQLPVGPAIRSAYAFAFGQLGTIIGLIWAPMVGIAVLRFLPYGIGDMTAVPGRDAAAAGALVLRGFVFGMVSILLYASINVAVIRQALGLRKGGAVFHFALGRMEFRLFAAMLFLAVIMTVMMFTALAGAYGIAQALPGPAGALAAAAVILAGACLLIVAMTRLGFLYVPATVAEGKIDFERCWRLTRGNFWRISAVWFVVTLPIVVIVFLSLVALMGRDIATLLPAAAHLSPEAISARFDAIMERHIATILGINLIAAPFSLGLMLGASAAGYKVLAAPPPAAEA